MSRIVDLHNGLAQALTTEPTFVADMQALQLGAQNEATAPKVLRAKQKAKPHQSHWPCWVMEVGDLSEQDISNGAAEPLAIGSVSQSFAIQTPVWLFWHQPDNETAYRQRQGLTEPLVRLCLRIRKFGGVGTTRVIKVQPDYASNHPTQVLVVTFETQFNIDR